MSGLPLSHDFYTFCGVPPGNARARPVRLIFDHLPRRLQALGYKLKQYYIVVGAKGAGLGGFSGSGA